MKHKEKKKHLESRYLKPAKQSREEWNLREHLLKHDEAGEDSHSTSHSTSILPTNKQSGADTKNFEEYAPQVLAEAPDGGPTEEGSRSSEYFSHVSYTSKLQPPDTHGTHQLYQNVFCPGSNAMPVSKSCRKRKSMEGDSGCLYGAAGKRHEPFPPNPPRRKRSAQSGLPERAADIRKSQKYDLQSQKRVDAAGCGPAKESSPRPHHLTCVSSASRHDPPNNPGTHQLYQNVFCPGSNAMPVSKSCRKRKSMEGDSGCLYGAAGKRHEPFPPNPPRRKRSAQSGLPERAADTKNFQENAPQVLAEVTGHGPIEEGSRSSEYVLCVSSPSNLRPPDTHDTENFQEYAPQVLAEARGRGPSEEGSCSSESFSCVSSASTLHPPDTHDTENFQEYAPQVLAEVPHRGPAEEGSSSSEYFSCVSSPSKLRPPDTHGTIVTPETVVFQQAETSSSSPHASFLSLFSNNKPCTSLVLEEDERIMKIYYTRVQKKRESLSLEDPEEGGSEPSPKNTEIEEITYIEKVFENTPSSQMSMKRPPKDCRPYLDSRAQKRKEVERPASTPALWVYPRATCSPWLGPPTTGFKCMACCHIFPSLDDLKEHVKHGLKEGFSCRSFHLTLAYLRRKNCAEEEKGKEDDSI